MTWPNVVYEEPPLEYGRHLDGNFAIGITVSQEAKANTVEVCEAIEARIAEMNSDPELEGVNFLVWFSQGRRNQEDAEGPPFTGIFGAILASIVLFLFLRRVSTTIVSVMCIPFSLIVTCGLIWAQGKTLNTLTLLGLIVGIGMLVDNAVVVMENIFRHQEMGDDQKTAARLGAREVSTAVIAATFTSVIVFHPADLQQTQRNEHLSQGTGDHGLSHPACVPVHQPDADTDGDILVHQVAAPRPKSRAMIRTEVRSTKRMLRFMLHHRWITPVIGLVIIASAVYPFMKVDKNFDASETEMFVQVRYEFSEEPSLEKKEEYVNQVEAALEPYRDELKARSIYSFWSDRWTLTRVYLREGEANEDNVAAVRESLRDVLPEIAGLKLRGPGKPSVLAARPRQAGGVSAGGRGLRGARRAGRRGPISAWKRYRACIEPFAGQRMKPGRRSTSSWTVSSRRASAFPPRSPPRWSA